MAYICELEVEGSIHSLIYERRPPSMAYIFEQGRSPFTAYLCELQGTSPSTAYICELEGIYEEDSIHGVYM